MNIDEMINFHVNECITLIEKEVELKIVDGVYKISCENELEFNKEEIKKLLLMFKPMQKELEVCNKAFDIACSRLEELDKMVCSDQGPITPPPYNKTKWKNLIYTVAKGEVNHDNP